MAGGRLCTSITMTKNALKFTEQDSSLTVGGRTFLIKDNIKILGGRWNSTTKTWSIPTSNPESTKKLLLDAYAELDPVMTVPKALALKSDKWKWICCEHCVVHDWQRQHTSCFVHADSSQFGTDFRVRGILYYGD